ALLRGSFLAWGMVLLDFLRFFNPPAPNSANFPRFFKHRLAGSRHHTVFSTLFIPPRAGARLRAPPRTPRGPLHRLRSGAGRRRGSPAFHRVSRRSRPSSPHVRRVSFEHLQAGALEGRPAHGTPVRR